MLSAAAVRAQGPSIASLDLRQSGVAHKWCTSPCMRVHGLRPTGVSAVHKRRTPMSMRHRTDELFDVASSKNSL
jgi:hypothetical protein